MKRIPRLPALAGVIVAAACLMSLTPTSNAQPYGYYGGGYGPGYEGYSVYGQGPYAYGSPTGYSYPADGQYRYRGYGSGPYGYASPRVYARDYNYRAYSPYNMSLYRPYSDPYYTPFGYQSHSAYYQTHHGF